MKFNSILVSVILLTYNHDKYIKEAINSVIRQVCNFEFELIIGEDCSADNTKQIVLSFQKEYPRLIKLITSENNIGAILNEKRCLENARGKYIAYLEGDDFWTDPLKLQKQVDFLEANYDYGLVHGDVNHLIQKTGKIQRAYNKRNNIYIPEGDIFNDLMMPSHIIKTMTVCFRREILEKYYLSNNVIMNSAWKLIDISIWLMIALYSKIHYFDEVFATYRLLPESMSISEDPFKTYKFHGIIYQIRSYYLMNYDCSEEIIKEVNADHYRSVLYDSFNMSDYKLARESYMWLLKNGVRVTNKEMIMFLATKYKLAKYMVKLGRLF